MNRETVIAATALVRLVRFEHDRLEPHRDPAEESSDSFSVNFVESGSFGVAAEGREQEFHSGMALLLRPGLSYRCRHRQDFPDDVCLSVECSDPVTAEEAEAMTRGPALRPTNRLAYARLRLLASSDGQPLALEARAMELLEAVAGGSANRLFRPRQLAWYARRIDRVRQLLEARYSEALPLTLLAREAGMSRFHFAHVFRELTGTPPHRHLTTIRLRHARRLIKAGRSVTDACFDVGFTSLSHFIRRFRREFGVTPSRLRRPPTI